MEEDMKQIKITLAKAKEIYKEGNTAMNTLLLENFTESELKGKRKWSELDTDGYFPTAEGEVYAFGPKGTIGLSIGCMPLKATWPTEEIAKAAVAMSQLAWWMRQPEYNGEDQDDWCDWEYSSKVKYCLHYDNGHIVRDTWGSHQYFLAFKTPEIRDRFLEDRRELIEQAKPLL